MDFDAFRRQAERIELAEDCWLLLCQVFDPEQASCWMRRLRAEVPLEQRSLVFFGKQVVQPRLIGWAGALPYTYSRATLVPRPFGPTLEALLQLTLQSSGHAFNHALVNLYRDGNDSMGMHSDDEPELGPDPVIASWSFGAERRLVFAEKRGKHRLSVVLPSGSLLVMQGRTQARFRHGLPKVAGLAAERLNVTFRSIAPAQIVLDASDDR